MRDGHLIWYFYAICLGVLGAGLLAAGLRNPHARANIAFGILAFCAAALYMCRGWREKRKQAGGTGIDENNMEDDENE
ncbi:MAG: hypothetical protein K2P37_01235 [Oscillospiraceae bacterium]|nr:hypothetical protein [Oscillospiraceae bacterium]